MLVLVAVSGGPDSVALLRGLLERREQFELQLHVAHFNHRFRGLESDREAEWVAQLARASELPFTLGQSESAEGAVREESARHARYDFLRRVAAESGAGVCTSFNKSATGSQGPSSAAATALEI